MSSYGRMNHKLEITSRNPLNDGNGYNKNHSHKKSNHYEYDYKPDRFELKFEYMHSSPLSGDKGRSMVDAADSYKSKNPSRDPRRGHKLNDHEDNDNNNYFSGEDENFVIYNREEAKSDVNPYPGDFDGLQKYPEAPVQDIFQKKNGTIFGSIYQHQNLMHQYYPDDTKSQDSNGDSEQSDLSVVHIPRTKAQTRARVVIDAPKRDIFNSGLGYNFRNDERPWEPATQANHLTQYLDRKLHALFQAVDREADRFSEILQEYFQEVVRHAELYQENVADLVKAYIFPLLLKTQKSEPNYVQMFDEACTKLQLLMQEMTSNKRLYLYVEDCVVDVLLSVCKEISVFSAIAQETCLYIIGACYSSKDMLEKIIQTRLDNPRFYDATFESFRIARAQFLRLLVIPFLKDPVGTTTFGSITKQRQVSFEVLPDQYRAVMQETCIGEIKASLLYEPSAKVRRFYGEMFTNLALDEPLDPNLFKYHHSPHRALIRGRQKMHRLKMRLFYDADADALENRMKTSS